MTERAVPSRHEWLPSALPVLFGQEPVLANPWPALRDALAIFAVQAGAMRDQALNDAASLDGIDSGLLSFELGPWEAWQETTDDFNAPMRVVLMGRTMAGKSSLLAALSGSHFDRIGDGRQRFSRDVFAAIPTASGSIEVVDTPGVGARDGAEDFALAFSAARDADLILWVASNDSIQEDTARALRELGLIGKPIIVALNCRQSLAGVGRLNLLKFPERVFGDREGLVDEITRHMAAAAVKPLNVIYLHALAATEALAHGSQVDAELYEASRIDYLTDALNREHAAHSESRRALRVVDGQRQQADSLVLSLALGSTALRAHANQNRKLNEDVHSRLTRVVRAAGEGMVSDIAIAVGQCRDWHLNLTDFGKSLQQDWEKRLDALHAEVNQTLDNKLMQLRADADSTITAAEAEWASVSPDQFVLRDLTGFDSVLGNRMARAGFAAIGVAGSLVGLKLGVVIGSAIGLTTGPGAVVTAIVGGIVGAAVGLMVKPLKQLTDSWILGKDGVLRKRRDEVAKQVGPRLDELKADYERAVSEQLDVLQGSLASERGHGEVRSATLDSLADRWTHHSKGLHALIRELDKETTSALLRIAGRERLARSLKRATRVPGVCILAEFENSAFWESWLYPPDIGERLAGGRVPSPGGEAAGALSYALGLVDAPAHLSKADSSSATICVNDDLLAGIAETWSDALTSHIRRNIRIESTRRSS
ncbi:GTPase [Cryobacterium sp. PH31-O1]|uniref:GTPase n=1 Tax=Cryobacterium sp. PH31-O1 TaxID=3046306 RepID=UPI0024B8914E|nr:GTPase [Cryobacterium sp. PH31-O1]MDJ0338687.1 50S ribosome-binding GTPase [Cryobacterium sp. PH31-O1]